MMKPCLHRSHAPAFVSVPILHWRTRLVSSLAARQSRCAGALSHPAIGAADDKAASPRPSRPRRTPVSEAEDVSTQEYLQSALGLDAAAARSLSLRTHRPYLLQLSTCQGWVTYLKQQAGGDTNTALAILQKHAQVLDYTFDQQRQEDLDELQSCLATVGVSQQQLLLMTRRRPFLLVTPPSTVAAATAFLLAQHGGDAAAVHHLVLQQPQLLTASVRTLRLYGGSAGQPPAAGAAPGRLGALVMAGFQSGKAEQLGEWLQQQGFTPEQVLRFGGLATGALRLPALSTEVLQRRLDFFTHTCGIPANRVRDMLTGQPAAWALNLHSHVTRLKLRYWQQELGYSLSNLPLAVRFLMSSLVSSASRHSFLRDLLYSPPSPPALLQALIPGRVGATQRQLGPIVFAAYVRRHDAAGGGGGGTRVQDLLQPLSARLSQAAHQEEWAAALQASPPLACAGRPTPQHSQLYAALDAIAARDWPLSEHGQTWTAAAAEAAAADRADAVRQRDAIAATRALAKTSPKRTRGAAAIAIATAVKPTRAAPAAASAPTPPAAGAAAAAHSDLAATPVPLLAASPPTGHAIAAAATAAAPQQQAMQGRGALPGGGSRPKLLPVESELLL